MLWFFVLTSTNSKTTSNHVCSFQYQTAESANMIDNCVVKFRLSNGTWKITTFCINQGQYVNKFKTDLASSYRFNTNFMAILSSFYNHFQYGFQTNPECQLRTKWTGKETRNRQTVWMQRSLLYVLWASWAYPGKFYWSWIYIPTKCAAVIKLS